VKIDQQEVEEVLGDLSHWALQCHGASLHIVKSGVVIPARVARGTCEGVGSQHSWVVLGNDCYDDSAKIIDPTLWSYDDSIEGVWYGSYKDGKHRPHGKGSIWNWGRPPSPVEDPMELTPQQPLSDEAQLFLELLGPLDERGWITLAHAPVEHWPAKEIITAICDSGLDGYVPIDIKGMITDRNPSGLYLAAEASKPPG